MKITFFYTSYDQLEINSHIIKIFKNLNKLNYNENDICVDIIIHNNNKEYNREMIIEKSNIIKLKKCKYVQNVRVIHTTKNIGYLFGACQALSDNYDTYKDSDFVIHLNTNIIIKKIDLLITFLFDNQEKHTCNKNKEIAKPIIPSMKILLLPILSLNLPQKGLKKIHAKAEIEKISPI